MRTVDFSVLILRKAFVEALGLDFCPAALSRGVCCRCIVGQNQPKAQWFGAGQAARAGERWHWEATAVGVFQPLVTITSTFTCWLVSSLQTKRRCVANIC